MPTCLVDGAELVYDVQGSGPAIVFAHGAGGNRLSWWQQVPYFRERYTCVTFDHRGYGRSVDRRPMEQQPRFEDDLAALVEHLGFADVRLVAQSMGGWTCLGFALRHPERVRALVMGDTHGGLATAESHASWQRALQANQERRAQGAASALINRAHTRPELQFLYDQIGSLNPPDATSRVSPVLFANPMVQPGSATELRLPVLFIEGEEDTTIPPDVVRTAQSIIPNAQLEMVPEAGHSVYFERPDIFNFLVDRFFKAVGAAPES